MSGLQPITFRRFGRYQLIAQLGKGGMATLYLARLEGPQHFERLVAIKRIHDHLSDELAFVRMFLDEARLTARIQHPNVVSVFEMGQESGAYYLAMEFIQGGSLRQVIAAAKGSTEALPWSEVVYIVAEAAAGLHAAHELRAADGGPLGVVHRDVSPQNILLSYEGEVKVVDFGIAYAAERLTETTAGVVKGKMAYMSPEQANAESVDRRADVFALGIVLHEALCFRRLFRCESDAATLVQVRDAQVPRLRQFRPELPEALEEIVLRALARRPEDRFATAEELELALRSVLRRMGQFVGRTQIAARMRELIGADQASDAAALRKLLLTAQQTGVSLLATVPDVPPTPLPMDADGDSSSNPRDQPLPLVSGATTYGSRDVTIPDVSAIPPQESPTRAGTGRLSALLVATVGGLVALVLLLLAVVTVWKRCTSDPDHHPTVGHSTQQDRAPLVPPDTSATAVDAQVGQVQLALRIDAPGVTPVVTFRGIDYFGHEFRKAVPRSTQKEVILVRARGYTSRRIELVPERDYANRITLSPEFPVSRFLPMVSPRPSPRRRPTDHLRDLPRFRP